MNVLGMLVACHGAPEAPPPSPEGWVTVAADLGGALLSVTGTAADDVWAVGAEDGGPLVLRFDGAAWERLDTGSAGDLWWAWRPPEPRASELWAAGADGRVLRFDGEAWGETVLDPELTLFGVWGSSEDDVYAVGGRTDFSAGAAMFHWDGGAWAALDLPELEGEIAVYKVWGTGPDDVWACGTDGLVLHGGAGGFARVEAPSDRLLLTVAGDDREVYVVGGTGNAAIERWDGERLVDESPRFAPELNGVSVRDGAVVAVGRTGAVWAREDGAWIEDPRGRATYEDLHATWIDPDGGVWMVGGALATLPMLRGTLIYGGEADVGSWP